jgi:hypothetical protein
VFFAEPHCYLATQSKEQSAAAPSLYKSVGVRRVAEARPRRCGSTASAFLQTRPRRAWNGEVRSHGRSARNCDGAGVRVGIGDEAGDEIGLDDGIDATKGLCDVDVGAVTAVVVLELESAGPTKFRVIPPRLWGTVRGANKLEPPLPHQVAASYCGPLAPRILLITRPLYSSRRAPSF